MNKTYCDKCGKETTGNELNIEIWGDIVRSEFLDFCPGCFSEFVEVLEQFTKRDLKKKVKTVLEINIKKFGGKK